MSWARLDDRANEHRKLLAAGAEACWLWSCGLMYANRQKARDGFIPEPMVAGLYLPLLKVSKRLANKLVEVGLWEKVKGGYQIHDYHAINSTPEKHQAQKEKGRLRAAKSYESRKVRGLLGAGSSDADGEDSSPDSSPISSREESAQTEAKKSDSSGVEWSGGGSGDSDLGSQIGSTPPEAARAEALISRAKMWLEDPNRAQFECPKPESWPETARHVAKLHEVFGGAQQILRTSSDPRMLALLGRWAEGHTPGEIDQAITGAKLDDHIARHPQYQTFATILRDGNQVARFIRCLTVPSIAKAAKTNPRVVQPSQGEDAFAGVETVGT